MFSRVGSQAIKNGLDNILELSRRLGNPHLQGRFVHIAGTNGKGSVSHLTASVLQEASYTTGLYTSPHLKDLRERIKIDGAMIPKEQLVHFIEKIKPAIETIHPSFFEITVAMAFDYFASQATDFSVIETGLGGRLDSTNIIQPEIAVITNIGYDHVKILGNTLGEIAREKAGIIKENGIVVVGESHPKTAPIFRQAAEQKNARLVFADKELSVVACECQDTELVVTIKNHYHSALNSYTLDQAGSYQAKNLLSVLTTIELLRQKGYAIPDAAVWQGLRNSKKNNGLHGRWETLQTRPRVILDVAHNPDGIKQVLFQLDHLKFDRLHLVLGMVSDKDVKTVLSLLPRQAVYYFTEAAVPRAMGRKDLQGLARLAGLAGDCYADVNLAIRAALEHSSTEDLILVCGSVFLVGEVDLAAFTKEEL